MLLQDMVALITGGGSGIGRAMALAFAREGAAVACADISAGAADETAQLVRSQGARALALQLDVTQAAAVSAALQRVLTEFGKLDILCNNAGIGVAGKVAETDESDWDRIMTVNVKGVFLGSKYAIPLFLAQGHGCIINTASVAGLVGVKDRAAYCASKGAVIALTKAMAVDHARDNIRINCIAPGTVETPWVKRINAHLGDYEQVREVMAARQPMGRMGTPEEVAEAAVYLASPRASFVHGSALVIDGGLTAQ